MNPYSYPSTDTAFHLTLKNTTRNYWRYRFDFTSAFLSGWPESRTVSGEYFQPRRSNKAPLVILLHGMGDHSLIPCRLLARALVRAGIACLVPHLLLHSSRLPAAWRRGFPTLSLEQWFQMYQASVIEVRQAIDCVSRRGEINKDNIAVLGISFGGFISAIAMGVDERIKAGVFIVTGGNGEKINQKSRLSSIRRGYRRTEAEYQSMQQSYRQYLSEIAEKGLDNTEPPRIGFLTDPMTFAHRLHQRPVLMINARWDEAVPREAVLDFWQEAGKPAIAWFPTTHATLWLWYPLVRQKVVNFLMGAFKPPALS
jgi:cephalosporin-C deacetylase-like acetyl esterase